MIFKTGSGIIQTGKGIIFPTSQPLIKKLLLIIVTYGLTDWMTDRTLAQSKYLDLIWPILHYSSRDQIQRHLKLIHKVAKVKHQNKTNLRGWFTLDDVQCLPLWMGLNNEDPEEEITQNQNLCPKYELYNIYIRVHFSGTSFACAERILFCTEWYPFCIERYPFSAEQYLFCAHLSPLRAERSPFCTQPKLVPKLLLRTIFVLHRTIFVLRKTISFLHTTKTCARKMDSITYIFFRHKDWRSFYTERISFCAEWISFCPKNRL